MPTCIFERSISSGFKSRPSISGIFNETSHSGRSSSLHFGRGKLASEAGEWSQSTSPDSRKLGRKVNNVNAVISASSNDSLDKDSLRFREFWSNITLRQENDELEKKAKKSEYGSAENLDAISVTTFNILAPIYKRIQKVDLRFHPFLP